jgi:hypothetical protein
MCRSAATSSSHARLTWLENSVKQNEQFPTQMHVSGIILLLYSEINAQIHKYQVRK